MKKLFIYYSHSGNGDKVADYLKEKGFDIRKVIPKKDLPKNFFLSIMVGGFKASVNYHDKLKDFSFDINPYEEIWIGSPIWNARLSSPINSVIRELKLDDKKVTFVFYSGGGTSPKASEKVRKLYENVEIIDLQDPLKNEKELIKLDKMIKK